MFPRPAKGENQGAAPCGNTHAPRWQTDSEHGLFAIVPMATIGVIRMLTLARRSTAVGLFVVALFLGQFPRRFGESPQMILNPATGFRTVDSDNAAFRRMENALRGQHIFSTVERLALLDPAPALVNAFSFWTIHPQPIYGRIRNSEFDVVITPATAVKYRGVDFISPDLRKMISAAYAPHCVIRGALLHLRRNRPADNVLLQKLSQIGCVPIEGPQDPAGLSW